MIECSSEIPADHRALDRSTCSVCVWGGGGGGGVNFNVHVDV